MRLYTTLNYKFFLVIFGLSAAMECCATTSGILGNYISVGSHRSTMHISGKNDRMHIALNGGASSADMASVSGDCEAIAEGQLVGNVIRAKLIPFEGEVSSLDSIDIERMDPIVIVTFEKGRAIVQGSFAHCGLRNNLTGKYKKRP